jgi:hypothetical protein
VGCARTLNAMPSLNVNDIHNATSSFLAKRDVQSDLTPTPTQRTTLIVAGCYIIIIAILWYVDEVSIRCLQD